MFKVPTSDGKYYELELFLTLDADSNHLCLAIDRHSSDTKKDHFLDDDESITVIIRPDIEDRSFHETIKAYTGPEHQWPAAIKEHESGFSFSLSNTMQLCMSLSDGTFISEPEWHYMVQRPMEAQRGLDAESDLFSPGYFQATCNGGDSIILNAAVVPPKDQQSFFKRKSQSVKFSALPKGLPLSDAFMHGLDAFIVDRKSDKSVIAGYPWFLDWGRDSLIFCRSLIEIGRLEDAKAILRLFGRFENNGTLPNMICGSDARNIETSDAPLWFFACCKDLILAEKSTDFLEEKLGDRRIGQILLSAANSLLKGTPTGVIADPETGLLYSPSHFTWMDTNFPAGSPRQGYPVEIQALWHNALTFLASVDTIDSKKWKTLANQVHSSIIKLFYKEDLGFFSDCLHGDGPVGAKQAQPDDALRPNQLFLVTLGVIGEKELAVNCVEACLELIVPGGIRSLADRKVEYPINIFYNGNLLKDPHYPYSGEYKGDEDTQRKPAYHNGTAWSWPFPVFCEAWAMVFGETSKATGLAWIGSFLSAMRKGAAGYIPEILDGNYPHTPRGCDAQAWGVSEAARVVHKLSTRVVHKLSKS